MVKTNERVNGIFDQWNVPDDYAKISETHALGRIKGDARIKNKEVSSTAMSCHNTVMHTGIELTIENERGEGTIYLPQTEFPEIRELAAMNGSLVEYSSRTWSSYTEGTSVDIKLNFLDGELAGRTYEGREFA